MTREIFLGYCWACLPKSSLDKTIDPKLTNPEIELFCEKPICSKCSEKKKRVQKEFDKWKKNTVNVENQ